jgi:hypothetical protein
LRDEVFARISQDVRLFKVTVAQPQGRKVGDESRENAVGKPVFVVEGGRREDSLKSLGILRFQRLVRLVENFPQVLRFRFDGVPSSFIGNLEAVVVSVLPCELSISGFSLDFLRLFLEHVREPLEEKESEDIILKVCRVDMTAKFVGGSPKMGLQSFKSDLCHYSTPLIEEYNIDINRC